MFQPCLPHFSTLEQNLPIAPLGPLIGAALTDKRFGGVNPLSSDLTLNLSLLLSQSTIF